jgi:prepilin-type N-terminal cleavage/methylation domain-containing protein
MFSGLDGSDDAGFTLMEMLIVIVVLGILSGIVIFGVSNIKSNSKDSACKAEKASVETALETYKAKTGSYPASPDQSPLTAGGYLKEVASHVTAWNSSGIVTGTTDCS